MLGRWPREKYYNSPQYVYCTTKLRLCQDLSVYCCIVAKGGDIVVKKHNKAKPSGDAVWRGENGYIVVLFRF